MNHDNFIFESPFRRAGRWLMFAFFVALAIASCWTRAEAQTPVAWTRCDTASNAISITFSPEALSPGAPLGSIVAHELVHVEQMRRAGSCLNATRHYMASQYNAAAIEAEAYCASWGVARARGDSDEVLFGYYVRFVWQSAEKRPVGPEGPLTPAMVVGLFERFCPQYIPGG